MAYSNLGVALADKGEPEGAIKSYLQAIKIDPNFAEAHRHLSTMIKYHDHHTQIFQMRALYQDIKISDDSRCHLCFGLAKEHEDVNEIYEAFHYWEQGNTLRKKLLGYRIEQDKILFSNIKAAQPLILKNSLKSSLNYSGLTPIFILGMPRSGTTLVEQIVSSHSEVNGAGELVYVSRFGKGLTQGLSAPSKDKVSRFRTNYLSALTKLACVKRLVTDKTPQNFLHIALICAAILEAKIIHVQRDAAATCWSNYKHYFSAKGLGYSYNLNDTFSYFKMYQELMDFWGNTYGHQIYDLDYDRLTIEQESQTRKLIEYLELDWDVACLSPQENKRAIQTASQQQVREKVYKGSSHAWRRYEPYLNGVFNELSTSPEQPPK